MKQQKPPPRGTSEGGKRIYRKGGAPANSLLHHRSNFVKIRSQKCTQPRLFYFPPISFGTLHLRCRRVSLADGGGGGGSFLFLQLFREDPVRAEMKVRRPVPKTL